MSPEEIAVKLKESYVRYLEAYGVEWPGAQQLPALLCLFDRMPSAVSQTEILEQYRAWKLGFEYNRQARHLAEMGWHIASGNRRSTRMPFDDRLRRDELVLRSVNTPNPVWMTKGRMCRQGVLSAASWSDILALFSGRGCAVCGRKMKSYDKGHLDPLKPFSLGNVVPMCADCNNWAASLDVSFSIDDNLIARPTSLHARAPGK